MKRIVFVMLLVVGSINILSAQTIVGDTLFVDGKAGSVAKALKKNPMITCLKATGNIDNKDLEAISAYYKLKYIDLSECVFSAKSNSLYTDAPFKYIYIEVRAFGTFKLFKKAECKGSEYPLRVDVKGGDNLELFASKNTVLGERCHSLTIYDEQTDQIAQFSAIQYRFFGASGKLPVSILRVPNTEILNSCVTRFEYNILYNYKTNESKLIRWNGEQDGKEYIENASYIEPFGIREAQTVYSLTLYNLTTLKEDNLYNMNNLAILNLKKVEVLEPRCLNGIKITSLTLPATLKRIEADGLYIYEGKLKTIEFTGMTPPVFNYTDHDIRELEYKELYVPKGALQNYLQAGGIWSKIKIREKGNDPRRTIHCEQPGTLETYLTDDIIQNTDYLKVTGKIYDNEKEKVKKIKFLKEVDWSGVEILKSAETLAAEKEAEQKRIQWEKDRPKREAAERQLAEKRRKYGVGSVSEGYNIGYNDGYRCVNCYWNYAASTSPLYTEGFLDGYMQGFSRGQNDQQNDQLMRMRRR